MAPAYTYLTEMAETLMPKAPCYTAEGDATAITKQWHDLDADSGRISLDQYKTGLLRLRSTAGCVDFLGAIYGSILYDRESGRVVRCRQSLALRQLGEI